MDDDEFDFSDADLDDLPASTLQQLETTAIRATQQQQQHTHSVQAEDLTYYRFDDDDGDGDGEVVNLDDTAHFPNGNANHGYAPNHGYEPRPRSNGSNAQYGDAMDVEQPPPQSQVDVGKLLERIKKLEQEKRRLNRNLETASAEIIKKAGEVDNIRRRTEAATRATEQRLAQQQQEHRELTGKVTAERDALLRQLEQARTNSAFDEHNRHEDQMRRPRRTVPTRPKPAAPAIVSPAATPKKGQKTLPLGDGFDDEDVAMLSPTKRRDRTKTTTPKQASKRKRQVTNDSPIQVLELSEPRGKPKTPQTLSSSEPMLDIALLRNLWKDDQRFTLLHRLLAHRSSRSSDRILEALTQYAFPSDPEKKLSSIVYDSFSTFTPSTNARELAASICRTFVTIWQQSLRQRYYAPIYLILDALQFVLACEPAKTAIEVIEQIIPLVVESVKLVAIPVYEARNRNQKKISFLFSEEYKTTVFDIDAQACLELLYLIATRCVSSTSQEPLARFWKEMPLDFVLLVLLKEQPIPDMLLTLRILSTSALPASLGPITSPDTDTQNVAESNLISRLTNLFSETIAPIADPHATSPPVVDESPIWTLRLRILDLLTQFSAAPHGANVLTTHALCIGRLIKYLNHAVSSLYTRPLSPSQPLKIQTINASMRLLAHLNSLTPIKAKLNETLGGLHAYYVCLTRLAFSEGIVLEEGIEQDVVDMAHDVLDDGISPEEGDALAEVFPSGESA